MLAKNGKAYVDLDTLEGTNKKSSCKIIPVIEEWDEDEELIETGE